MGFGIKLRVWGDYACFTRPEMKAERVSYDVITPSAARSIIESIYWKPSIKWVIDKITVLSQIKFGNIKINEVKKKAFKPKKDLSKMSEDDYFLFTEGNENRDQRNMTFLKDPHYLIEAHFESSGFGEDTNDFKKHYNMALRRFEKGQFFKQPCMGIASFAANFALVGDNEKFVSPLKGEVDLGYMLYDLKFRQKALKSKPLAEDASDLEKWARLKEGFIDSADALFYRPIMVDGVIDVKKCLNDSLVGGEYDNT